MSASPDRTKIAKSTLERRELVAIGEKALSELCEHPATPAEAPTCTIFMTSGTSGSDPIATVWDWGPDEIPEIPWENVIVAIGSRCVRLLYVLRNLHSESTRRVLAIDDNDLGGTLSGLIAEFAPEGLCGNPAFIQRVGEQIDARTADAVRFIQLTGQMLTPAYAAAYKGRFAHGDIEMIYGAAEVGILGAQPCRQLPPNCYHPVDRVTMEIDEPDESGVGDVIVSKDFFRDENIFRYRIGDLARQGDKLCACGKKYFEFVGRQGLDRVKVAGALLLREEFDRVAGLCRDLFDDYRAEGHELFEKGDLKGAITLTVFAGGRTDEELRGRIADRFARELFLTPTRTLAQLSDEDVFLPLAVEMSAGPLPRESKEIKIRQKRAV